MIEVVNWRSYCYKPGDIPVFIGRQSAWIREDRIRKITDIVNMSVLCNHIYLADPNDMRKRWRCIEQYNEVFLQRVKKKGTLRDAIVQLYTWHKEGKNIKLVCFCKPAPCHGDFIRFFVLSQKGA